MAGSVNPAVPAEESGAGHQTLENPEGLGCLEDQILPSSFPLDHRTIGSFPMEINGTSWEGFMECAP